MKLHAIAHARAGDKGNVSDLTLLAFAARDYPRLVEAVTVARVQAQLGGLVRGKIERFLLPQLGAIKFVLHDALDGGVTRSLALDAHGKSYSSLLLDLDLPALPDSASLTSL